MWRVMGLVFFGDKDRFIATDGNGYLLADIKQFLQEKGIAMYDTAEKVIRERDNASDKYLCIIEPTLSPQAKKLPQWQPHNLASLHLQQDAPRKLP